MRIQQAVWTVAALVLLPFDGAVAQVAPGLRDVLNLETNGSPSISPDGRLVLYRTYASDWENDSRPSTLWISVDGGAVRQLELPGLRGGFEFCGDRIAYLVQEEGSRLLRRAMPDGAFEDAGPLPDRVRSFECSSDAGRLALAISEAPDSLGMQAVDLFGPHDIKDQGWTNTHLWVGDLSGDSLEFRRLTQGDFTVGSYSFSPGGDRIAFDHAPDPRSNSSYSADVSMVNVESGEMRVVADVGEADTRPYVPDWRLGVG